MSAIFTSPSQERPLRSAASASRSGKISTFRRRATQILLAATSAGLLAAPSAAAEGYALEGYWLTSGGNSIVEIAPCGDSHKRLCGTLVWAAEGDGAVGTEVLTSFRLAGNKAGDKWEKGKIKVAGSKKSRAGKLKLNDGSLKVSTCKGSTCKNQTWTRPSASMTAQAGLNGGA